MSKGMNREATGGAKVFWRSLEMKADADRAAEQAGSDVIKRTVIGPKIRTPSISPPPSII